VGVVVASVDVFFAGIKELAFIFRDTDDVELAEFCGVIVGAKG
jgi:hypothetical protein